jgi:endonuclease I
MPLFTPFGNLLDTTGETGFTHSQRMQWDIGTAPGVACRREIVCINLTFNLEDFDSSHPKVTERVLKEWNRLDPPDDQERSRNDRIYKLQHNRNPFIDHPEFIDRIEFVK